MEQVLLIDDNESFRSIVKEILQNENFEVVEASNGDEGLSSFINRKPAAVITDILMPICDGLELLRALSGLKHEVPIICMSGGIQGCMLLSAKIRRLKGHIKKLLKPLYVPQNYPVILWLL